MNNAPSKKPKLWREAFDAFRRTAQTWGPWAAAFAMLLVPTHYMILATQLDETVDAASRHQLGIVIAGVINFVASYCYAVLYLRKEPVTEPPQFGLGGFFFWLGRMIAKLLAILVLLFAVNLIGIGFSMLMGEAAKHPLALITALLNMGVIVYACVKFVLVEPLAVSRIAPTLKTSWQLTRGNWVRLWWNGLVLHALVWLMLIGLFFIPLLVFYLVTPESAESPARLWGISLLIDLCSVTVSAAATIYACTACRILYREQSASGIKA